MTGFLIGASIRLFLLAATLLLLAAGLTLVLGHG